VIAKNLAMAGKRVIIKDRPKVISQVKTEYGSIFEYEIVLN